MVRMRRCALVRVSSTATRGISHAYGAATRDRSLGQRLRRGGTIFAHSHGSSSWRREKMVKINYMRRCLADQTH
ncbi:hypothetical protein DAEQUDRAFT_497081 [Daedalea quercina L-15889]|uniref:Uncharacterized protein n=1 Tax=Daedalea quercina L-15889 TaxID=1314783 RepID=A0A165MLB0_9APHY|nr:hypothetical protein DAEQUDRAFT_497081 [Daedalea quercina L-15889]